MANVQNVKFLRNGSLFPSRTAAQEGMEAQLNSLADGTAILGRYSGTTTGDIPTIYYKTLVGFVFNDGTNKSLTIFDVEGASADVEALRQEINAKLGDGISSSNTATAQLTALSGTSADESGVTSVWGAKKYASAYTESAIDKLEVSDTAVEGEYVSQVSETDGKIAVVRAALPSATTVSGGSKVIIDVTQDKGKITASAANITGIKLDGYEEASSTGDVATSDTLGQALGKLQKTIHEMDKTASAVDGQVVTTVSETDGKVSETKANVKDLQLGGYAKTNDTGDIASADTINVALSKLENKAAAITIGNDDHSINVTTAATGTNIAVNIKSGENVIKLGNDGIYTNLNVVKITSDLPAEIKERYELRDSSNVKIGESIDIAKDSHIVSINYIASGEHAQNLEYVYVDVSGNTQTTYVDMSSLVLEAEFASGVTVTNHVAHGVVDSDSEKDESNVSFLTVGADGFKISGIKDAIDTKINKLDASLSGNSTHLTVGVAEADGKITAVTVAESNVANADDLTTLSGKSVTEIASSNASISAVSSSTTDGTVKYDIVTDASKVKMTGFTAANSGLTAITTSSTVTEAVKAIETEIIANEQITSAALNDLASDLTDEIAARKAVDGQSGATYAANGSANYISNSTSLNDADVKLDAALKALSDATVNEVKVNGKTLTETSNAVDVKISAAASTGAESAAIAVNTANNGDVTISLLGLDCGTY